MTSLTKEEDFLEADQSIPGQKYVCLSFVSPEDILKKKDIFFNRTLDDKWLLFNVSNCSFGHRCTFADDVLSHD